LKLFTGVAVPGKRALSKETVTVYVTYDTSESLKMRWDEGGAGGDGVMEIWARQKLSVNPGRIC